MTLDDALSECPVVAIVRGVKADEVVDHAPGPLFGRLFAPSRSPSTRQIPSRASAGLTTLSAAGWRSAQGLC
jgi:hypothetical protein